MTDRTAVALLSMLVLWQTGAGHDCENSQKIRVEEGDQVSLTCTKPDAGYLAWYLTIKGPNRKRSPDQVGNCSVSGNGEPECWVRHIADYELTSEGHLTSTLTIKRSPLSSIAGKVWCSHATHNSKKPTPSCNIAVQYPANKVRNCRLQWNATDGSVFGSCDVDKISPEDGEYKCLWSHEISKLKVRINKHHSEELGNHSVRCMFQGYVLSKANRTGSFSLWISRGPTSVWLYAKRFPIDKPGKPEFASCPTAVTEGSNFTCLCRPSSSWPGTPRPVITWTPGSLYNPLRRFHEKRGLDGQKYTCNQYWGGWNDSDVETASYTMHVNSSVPKTTTASQTTSKGGKVTTTPTTISQTTSTGGKVTTTPTTISQTTSRGGKVTTTPTTMSWTTSRGGKVTTTPTTISQTTSRGGKVATTPTTVSSSGGTKDSIANESDHGPPIVIIASAAAGGPVVIIIVIVIVVVVLKRRGGARSTKDRSTKDKDADFEEYINDLYVSSDQCLSIHPHPHPPAAHLPDTTNQRAAAAAVSPASRDGGNAVDRDQETSFRSSTVPLARSGPAASRDGATTNQNAGADFEEYINDLYVSSDQCLSIHPHPHPPAAHLPDPTNQRAAAAAVSPASRDGGNAVDRDQETSFRSSTVPLSPSGPAASRDGPTTNQNAGAGPSREDEIPSDQGREPQEKTSTANNEDEYNVLNFHRGAPETSSIDTDAVYSHIDAVGKKP